MYGRWRGAAGQWCVGGGAAEVSPSMLVTVLTLVGGCVQLAGADGLYWVALSSALPLVGGVVNAWLFLTR